MTDTILFRIDMADAAVLSSDVGNVLPSGHLEKPMALSALP